MTEQVSTADAPDAVGPYSQPSRSASATCFSYLGNCRSIRQGRIQVGESRRTAEQCLKNLEAIARASGTELSNTVRTTLFLTDLGDFAVVNSIYAGFFKTPYPARACYAAKTLPKDAKVEIEVIIALS